MLLTFRNTSMLRNTAVRRRAANYEVNQHDEALEATCKEPPTRRQDSRANHFGVSIRAQVLTHKEHTQLKNDEITAITGVQKSEIQNIMKRAKLRGYKKEQQLQDSFFNDAARSGAPVKASEEVAEQVKATISKDRNSRTLTAVAIARRLKALNTSLSPMSILRIL